MLLTIRYVAVFLMGLSILFHCRPKDRYDILVKNELAKGIREDSLFLGMHLGMSDKEFYTHCWELNKKGMIRQGTSNTSVLYKMKELDYPAEMNFYPNFYEGRIYEMPVTYSYEGWSPWNKHLSSDSLQLKILNLYKVRYGHDFMEVTHPKKGTAFIKVDGNRRITIYKVDERQVGVIFMDLLVENKIKEPNNTDDSIELSEDKM